MKTTITIIRLSPLLVCLAASAQTQQGPDGNPADRLKSFNKKGDSTEVEQRLAPGDHSLTLRVGNLERRYLLHVPPGCDGKKPVPIVIMFHGGGGTDRGAMRESGWAQKADTEGFLAVFPNATPPDPTKPARFGTNGQVWNDGSGRFHAGQKNVPDVAFINVMIDDLIARFNVDRRRIYATGFSNGASMAFRVGVELSARIAAIAPFAGAFWLKQPKLDRPVSLYYITGDADPLNPFEGGTPKFATGAASRDMTSQTKPPAGDHVATWARLLGCQADPKSAPATPGVTTLIYSGGRDDSEVRFTIIKDHGHVWPGGKNLLPEAWVGRASDTFKSTDAIWAFFQKHACTIAPAFPPAAPKRDESTSTRMPVRRISSGLVAGSERDGFVPPDEVKALFPSGRARQRIPAQGPAALKTGNVPMRTFLDLPYAKMEGVEPKLTSLDLYAPPSATNAPILVWVHGGGWARGDKSQVASLPAAFVREGFVVASVNYRLAPTVQFDAQAQDVAAAIAWLRRHARDYGAAPEKLFLMGHSAGAHLVALVGTDESYLNAQGLSLSALRGVVPLDTEAYDLKGFAARFGGKLPDLYAAPFTQDPAIWAKASPATHVAKGKGIPPMIVAYSGGQKPHGNPSRKTDAEEFAAKLKEAGVTAEVIAAPEKTHTQIALEFGTPNDPVAARVFAFLKTILSVSAAPTNSTGFTPDDVRMGDAQFAYIDPEFLQAEGLAVWLDSQAAVWVGSVDSTTGLFKTPTGRDLRVDTGISKWSRYSNGPEWGVDANGPALFYVKDNAQGAGQLWRAEPPWDKPKSAQLTRDTEIQNWLCEPSVNPASPSTRVIVYHGKPHEPGNMNAWLDEDKPGQLIPFTDRMIVARWAYSTNLVTFAYRARPGQTETQQVTLVDTDTNKSRVITGDEGNKIDPWLWTAPEFGDELLLAVNVDNRALVLYRDVKRDGSPWQRIATLSLPADASHPTLKSVEPVNGGRGVFGRSYFTVQAGDDQDTATSIWLFGFSPDGHHLIRRLDDGAVTGNPRAGSIPKAPSASASCLSITPSSATDPPSSTAVAQASARRNREQLILPAHGRCPLYDRHDTCANQPARLARGWADVAGVGG